MSFKTLAITIIFFLVLPIISVYAGTLSTTIINHDLKTCQAYSSGGTPLQSGWEYYSEGNADLCIALGYEYIAETLVGPDIYDIQNKHMLKFVLFGLLITNLILVFLYTKKKTIVIAIPLFFVFIVSLCILYIYRIL